MENYLKEFDEYKYIVLCNGLFDAGFKNLKDALSHYRNQKKYHGYNNYILYDVDSEDDDKELERIREDYKSYIQKYLEELEYEDLDF